MRHGVKDGSNRSIESAAQEIARELPRDALALIAGSAPVGIVVLDGEGRYLYVNPAYCDLYRRRADEMLGRTVFDVAPDARYAEGLEEIRRAGRDGNDHTSGEYRRLDATGRELRIHLHSVPVRSRSGRQLFVCFVHDVTPLWEAEEELRRANERLRDEARHDFLTGLLNRQAIEAVLEAELKRAGRHGRTVAVVMLDVDQFKEINDTRGHAGGDKVLREIAEAIDRCTRSEDRLGRYGGDEFLLVLPEAGDRDLAPILDRIVEQVGAVGAAAGRELTLSGGAAARREGEGAEQLVERADHLLYRAKREGRNRVCWEDGAGARCRGGG